MRITSSKRTISKGLTAVLVAVAGLVLSIGPAGAITFDQPDGNLHPNVGAVLADYDPDSPGPDILCSGTLIASTVFLTASHCTAFLEAEGISQVWVTFASVYDEDSTSVAGLLAGSYVTNPQFGSGGASDTHDIAVVLLAQAPAGITPAQLPHGRAAGPAQGLPPARRADLHRGRVRHRAGGQDPWAALAVL